MIIVCAKCGRKLDWTGPRNTDHETKNGGLCPTCKEAALEAVKDTN